MTNVSGRNNSSRTQENLNPTALPGSENKGSDWLTDSGSVHFCRCENDQAEKLRKKKYWKKRNLHYYFTYLTYFCIRK